jgi:hypothetical protein
MTPLKRLGAAKAGAPVVPRIGKPTVPSPVLAYTETTPNARNITSATAAIRRPLIYDQVK